MKYKIDKEAKYASLVEGKRESACLKAVSWNSEYEVTAIIAENVSANHSGNSSQPLIFRNTTTRGEKV